jgi:hypothetical protein
MTCDSKINLYHIVLTWYIVKRDIPNKIGPNTEAARQLETANISLYERNKANKNITDNFLYN